MAITLTTANLGVSLEASGTSTTIAVNTTGVIASGDFLVACVGFATGETLSSIAGGSLTWSIDKNGIDGGSFAGCAICSAQCPAGLASGTTITATFTGTCSTRSLGMSVFSGVKTSSPVDGTPIGILTMASVQPWSTGNYAIAAGSVIVGISLDVATSTTNTPTAGSELWDTNDASGPNSVCAQYRIEPSAGSYPVSGSWGSANDSRVAAVAYLEAPPSGPQNQLAWIRA